MHESMGVPVMLISILVLLQNSKVDLNRGHGVQSILYSCQSWVQGQWQHLLQIIAAASRSYISSL